MALRSDGGMLSVSGVTKRFPSRPQAVTALRGVDLEAAPGKLTAILGSSGCGKTTLLRVIAGFERPDDGEVRLGGRLLASSDTYVSPERRGIAIVPQEGALFPHLRVAQNVAYGLTTGRISDLSGAARRARRSRVEELLELVGLPGYGQRRPDELSGGQQQRVALARALAPEPAVVLLDEPFSALDAALRVELREEVRDLLRGIGTTAILVTHDQQEALSLADHVAVMRDGRVVQAGSPYAVYSAPVDQETATFLGEAVLLPARFTAHPKFRGPCVDCALGCIAVRTSGAAALSGECMVMLRPEQLELAETGIPARVEGSSFFGHDTVVRLRLGSDGQGIPVRVRVRGHARPTIGELVAVRVVPGAAASVAASAYDVATA